MPMPRPRKPSKKVNPLTQVRKICLALPEAHEKVAWGAPTFRVNDKLFAMFALYHHGDAHIALWCKAPPGAQEMLVEADPKHFFVPPYVGKGGWVGIRLDTGLGWDVVCGPRPRGLSHDGAEAAAGVARRGLT